MRNGVCCFLGQESSEVEKAEAALPAKRLPSSAPGVLFSAKCLASTVIA